MTTTVESSSNPSPSFFTNVWTYAINFSLLGVIFYLLWKIFVNKTSSEKAVKSKPSLPPMKKRDFTITELKEYDGTKNDGRILIGVNGKVFDVTKGKTYYGPRGPYAVFAGRDASRGLATFSLDMPEGDEQYDDLSDLQPHEMDSVLEWEMQFKEKYYYVGRLLKPGETHNSYSDDECEPDSTNSKNKDD